MQTLLATLATLAVLNPLCCCLTLADLAEAKPAHEAPSSCCAGDSEPASSPEPGHDAAPCEHKTLKDSVLTPNSAVSLLEVPAIPVSGLFKTAIYPMHFHRSPGNLGRRGISEPFIENWVSVQTDCVRRL